MHLRAMHVWLPPARNTLSAKLDHPPLFLSLEQVETILQLKGMFFYLYEVPKTIS